MTTGCHVGGQLSDLALWSESTDSSRLGRQ